MGGGVALSETTSAVIIVCKRLRYITLPASTEVIGAIMSILGIWLLTAFLCYFSLNRLILNDFDIEARTMMVISGIGIGINVM